MKSVITPQEVFNRVASPDIERSTFDRSHGYKTTLNAGLLIPVFLDEALPGDTINITPTMFGRLSTPLKAIMDNLFLDVHFFSIPIRLLWSNFKKFNGEQDNPTDSTSFLIPTITQPAGGATLHSIYDYMGIPTLKAGLVHSALFNRAQNRIWNEWYRDQNLQTSVIQNTGDGPDTPTDYTVLPRGKRKDYFTSALPFIQKGPAVSIPLGGVAPVTRVASAPGWGVFIGGTQTAIGTQQTVSIDTTSALVKTSDLAGISLDPKSGGLVASLSGATAATINQLREAFQVQRMYEKDARGGTKYIELIKSHFGVTSPDSRQQRSEYLGGSVHNISINPIAQTEGTKTGTTPQSNISAYGTVSVNGSTIVKSFTEHEIIVGFVSIRADLNYQQGLNRMFSRSTRFDFFWPSLAHLGEQAILNKEIFAQGTTGGGLAADAAVFGYQERYAEYRYKTSQVTGQFRSNASTPLDMWHLSQNFSSLPALNANFIVENPPIARIVAVPSEPQFLLDCYFDYKHARPIPTFATPGMIDHF